MSLALTPPVLNLKGQMRPMTFVQGRINAQFLIEGFVASIMTAVGAFGWITVNYANQGEFGS